MISGNPGDGPCRVTGKNLRGVWSGWPISFISRSFVLVWGQSCWCAVPFSLNWLGVGVLLSGFVYSVGSLIRFLVPPLLSLFQPFYGIPVLFELLFALWLIFGTMRAKDIMSGSS